MLVSYGDCSPTAPAAPSLRPLVPSCSHTRCQSDHHPPFPLGAGRRSESGQCSYISSSYSVCSLFFRFWGGWHIHNVQSLIFRIPTEGSALRFTISSTRAFLKILPDILSLPRRSCPFKSRSLIPLLHSHCDRRHFPNVHPIEVPLATLSLPGPWRPSTLCG
jgi:hypothetical protein